jgi:hypothetical protein
MPELSESTLRYLTEVDHRDHDALVAIVEGTGQGIGVLTTRRASERLLDELLGFTAGVLLGFALGAGFIAALDAVVPHAHARFSERGRLPAEQREVQYRATLVLAALTIHNVPEGMAVVGLVADISAHAQGVVDDDDARPRPLIGRRGHVRRHLTARSRDLHLAHLTPSDDRVSATTAARADPLLGCAMQSAARSVVSRAR